MNVGDAEFAMSTSAIESEGKQMVNFPLMFKRQFQKDSANRSCWLGQLARKISSWPKLIYMQQRVQDEYTLWCIICQHQSAYKTQLVFSFRT